MALRKIQSELVSNLANISFNSGTIFSNLSVVGTLNTGILSATTIFGAIPSATNWNSVYSAYNELSGSYITNNYNGNVTILGSLSVLGDITYIDTAVTVTSALSVINLGTGPALVINQKGSQPIANFLDDDVSSLYIADGGNVGINITNPLARFTVNGAVSSSGNITTQDIIAQNITTSTFFISGGRDLSQVIRDNYSDVPTTYTTFHGVANKTLPYSSTRPFSANWDLNNYQSATLYLSAGNALLRNPTNQVAGGTYVLFVRTLSGNALLSFDSLYRFPNSAPPTVSQGPSAIDIFSFLSDGQYMYGTTVQNFTWA
jgi:hypothetical protein